MDDISFLPEDHPSKEEKQKTSSAPALPEKVAMHIPQTEQDDVEVIEVDEGEIDQVLQHEPLFSRAVFAIQAFVEDIKTKLFQPPISEPPPKLPPQFFKAPTIPAAPATTRATSNAVAKVRVIPEAKAPRRVRVIRRLRKPVHVSFLDQADVSTHLDVPRRRFTLIVMAVMLSILIVGGFFFISWQTQRVNDNLAQVQKQLTDTQAQASEQERQWETYGDLEPRLRALSRLLDQHLSPSKVFDALEALTVPDVWYSSFTLSPDGRLVLSTVAPSFDEAARQIIAFQQSGIASRVQAVGYQTHYNSDGQLEQVGFQISLTLDPKLLQALEPLSLR